MLHVPLKNTILCYGGYPDISTAILHYLADYPYINCCPLLHRTIRISTCTLIFSLLVLYSILQPTNRISSNIIVTAESAWTNRISTIIRFKILALSKIRQIKRHPSGAHPLLQRNRISPTFLYYSRLSVYKLLSSVTADYQYVKYYPLLQQTICIWSTILYYSELYSTYIKYHPLLHQMIRLSVY